MKAKKGSTNEGNQSGPRPYDLTHQPFTWEKLPLQTRRFKANVSMRADLWEADAVSPYRAARQQLTSLTDRHDLLSSPMTFISTQISGHSSELWKARVTKNRPSTFHFLTVVEGAELKSATSTFKCQRNSIKMTNIQNSTSFLGLF